MCCKPGLGWPMGRSAHEVKQHETKDWARQLNNQTFTRAARRQKPLTDPCSERALLTLRRPHPRPPTRLKASIPRIRTELLSTFWAAAFSGIPCCGAACRRGWQNRWKTLLLVSRPAAIVGPLHAQHHDEARPVVNRAFANMDSSGRYCCAGGGRKIEGGPENPCPKTPESFQGSHSKQKGPMLKSECCPVRGLPEPRLTVQDLPHFRQRLLCHVACLQGFLSTQLARPDAAVLLQKRPPPEQPIAPEVALLAHKRCGLSELGRLKLGS
jgi:hypothetical protein